ncbi:MAG: segregation/condensation protein A [Clostridia bacterium]|nr:segregation/condensation protein A [Clostridia bacterium]
MDLTFKLQTFEGPLDLLLHLIDKNKVDIYDIPIVLITEQYLDYIKQMDSQDLDIMSEFLVMAATLLDIKCKMLLPKEVNEEGEEEDPRSELVQKLIEYKMYKYMSLELKDKQIGADKSLYKLPTIPEELKSYQKPIDYEELVGDMDLSKLNDIFKAIIRRQEDKIDPLRSSFGKIEKDEIDMEAKALYIEDYIKKNRQFSFRNLLVSQASKMEIVVTFLVILEMMKIGKIMIVQENIFDDILITSKEAA